MAIGRERQDLVESWIQSLEVLEGKRKKLVGKFGALGVLSKIEEVKREKPTLVEEGWGKPFMLSSATDVFVACLRSKGDTITGKVVIQYSAIEQLIVIGRDVEFSEFVSAPTDGQHKRIKDSLKRGFDDPYLLNIQPST